MAIGEGYRTITLPILRKKEAWIIESIERGLASCDAVKTDDGTHVEYYRKASQLSTQDAEKNLQQQQQQQ